MSWESMAAEVWNRVNISFPGAVSSVRAQFSSSTDVKVKTLLADNETVLRLLRSEILQTEVRVLYELLYMLNNSFRGNKTFKGLKQVEQCINRLKNMKLDAAFHELAELCPTKIQRGLGIKVGECDVPSQPFLEWLSLKVLGAAQLMSCAMNRCNRAFTLSRQQMKWEEFIVLNMVIASMLSRLWVICRGILVSLSALYQNLLELLREVANSKPMPFLTNFSLPEDMTQFLDPADAVLLSKQPVHIVPAKGCRKKQQRRQNVNIKIKKVKEDLGVAVERDVSRDPDMKPFLKVFRNFTEGKSLSQDGHKKQKLKKQLREATAFSDMAVHLKEMITWCKSQRMNKEKHLLSFLHLKCQRLKCLEAAGYNVQRKLRTFRQEADRVLSHGVSVPRTCRFSFATWRSARLRTRFHAVRSRLKASALRSGISRKQMKRGKKKIASSDSNKQTNRTVQKMSSQTGSNGSHDDIDDIFASIGL
ncbi:uncharacterized protein V6R79_002803 [Siganus canaliculatus]